MKTWAAYVVPLAIAGVGFRDLAPVTSTGETTRARLTRVREAATNVDAMSTLELLTDRIGPRLTGSAPAHKAEQYVLARMRAMGLQNVHAEQWTLRLGWERGSADATLMTPFHLSIPIASYGWTGSTPTHGGSVPVLLIPVDEVEAHLQELVESQKESWRGKVLLLSSEANKPMHAYAQLLPLLRAATAAHAIAVFRHDTRPGNGLVHSEPVTVDLAREPDPTLIPALDLPIEHQLLLERMLRAKQKVEIAIAVKNHFTPRPVTEENILGEIAGGENAGQVTVVGAHLDSWDLGTGATDDGFGVAAVLGAAKAVMQSGLRPARTLRFILFTGEEQGLLGSRAYVRKHAGELDTIGTVVALDWGAGPIVRLPAAGHKDLLRSLTLLNVLAPELHLEAPDDGWMFMTDAYAFSLAGLPGIAPLVRAPGYSEQAHSAEDTLDKVKAADLRQATVVLAVCSFFLSDYDGVLRLHFSPEQTAVSLQEGKQRSMLEALGLWPF